MLSIKPIKYQLVSILVILLTYIKIGYNLSPWCQYWLLLYTTISQTLVQEYIMAAIIGCKEDTKTLSYYLLYYLIIYQWQHLIKNKDLATSYLQSKYDKVTTPAII